MKDFITRLSTQRGGLNPEAVETLSLEFDSPLYHLEYQLRHPFGIYNVSLGNVFSSFENLLLELAFASKQDIQSNKSDTKWNEDLLQSLEKLLYALMEHMDDCENIIKCFFPPGTKLNQEASFKNYQSSVNFYRTHIGKVVNHLKHNQGRLRSFGMIIDNIPHLGYFVEGISDDGSIGPAQHIHSGGSTAFSYARDIRFHLYYLYFVSTKLSEAIDTITKPDKNKIAYQTENKRTNLEATLQKIVQLPMVVFLDEIQKDFPLIAIENTQDFTKLSAELKKHPYGIRTAQPRTLYATFFKGDGVSRSFRMPYRNHK
jgi:hypothetical protein